MDEYYGKIVFSTYAIHPNYDLSSKKTKVSDKWLHFGN